MAVTCMTTAEVPARPLLTSNRHTDQSALQASAPAARSSVRMGSGIDTVLPAW